MAHALREVPWECCGLLGGVGEAVQSCHPLTNRALTPQTRYFASPEDLFPAMRSLREAGETLLAIYHSHPVGDPFPSETDLELAFYPQVVYLIVGPLHPEPGFSASPPEVRGFLLGGPEVLEVEIELEGRAEERRQILVDLLPLMGSAHPSEPDLSLGEGGASSALEPPLEALQLLPDEVLVGGQEEVVSVDALPEPEFTETPLVVPEEVELVEEVAEQVIVEPLPVIQEEVAPVDELPEEASDPELRGRAMLCTRLKGSSPVQSDEAPQELITEVIRPAVEPVPQLEAEEVGTGALEEAAGGWASRLTRKIRSAIARVTRWAFSGRDRQ